MKANQARYPANLEDVLSADGDEDLNSPGNAILSPIKSKQLLSG